MGETNQVIKKVLKDVLISAKLIYFSKKIKTSTFLHFCFYFSRKFFSIHLSTTNVLIK